MTGFNLSLVAIVAGLLTTQIGAKPKRAPSYRTWMRDEADHRLDRSLSEFFDSYRQEDDDEEITGPDYIQQLENGRVQFVDDIFISDYIQVDYSDWSSYDVQEEPEDGGNTDEGNGGEEKFSDHHNHIYFLMAESRSDPANDPLVIWLQGGPGCSSMLGMFTENGPYNFKYNRDKIKDPFEFESNEFSWNNQANVMYVDQPLGTGFSFVNELTSLRWSEEALSQDFVTFLHNFMEKYPEYKGREIYLTGESYAGHYIPNIARTMQLTFDENINLAGIAIGNGWTDPFYQYPAYPYFATQMNLISIGHSYVLRWAYSTCQFLLIFRIPLVTSTFCQMVGMTVVSPGLPDFNIYDVRLPCERAGLCYPDDHLWQLLNTYEYREAMGLPTDEGTLWEECATLPHLTLLFDFNKSYGFQLAPLLDVGLPVLIYNGDQDYICNWVGGAAWTNALVWDGQQEFVQEPMRPWQSSTLDVEGGTVKNFENFTFMRVYQAGHMVPTDQPEIAYDMIMEFIRTKKITGTN